MLTCLSWGASVATSLIFNYVMVQGLADVPGHIHGIFYAL